VNDTNLISIVPRLPPLSGGVGDYALKLAGFLCENVGVNTRFIVTDPAWRETDRVERFEANHLPVRSPSALINMLSSGEAANDAVLLHYSGYGYARRGCPFWLVKALEQWRGAGRGRALITMFHELYAWGPPWTSSFWLSPLQKHLTAHLARVSDQWLTSLEHFAEVVRRLTANETACAYHLPVFSNVGEPVAPPPLAARRRRLVVFGTDGRRLEVYRKSTADLNRICRRLGIEEILDVGQPLDFDFAGLLDHPVVICGELSGSEVSRLLLDAVAGVIDYPAAALGKSGIFAAYCAHRVIPFLANHGDSAPADGLEQNRHYWPTDIADDRLNLDAGQTIADNAFAWYQTHNLSVHATALANCLYGNGQPANRVLSPTPPSPAVKPRVLMVAAQPTQTPAPLRRLAQDARVETMTAYCSLPDAKLWRDPEHLTKEAFDVPMLDGYPWIQLRNHSPLPCLSRFYGLINLGVIKLVRRYDCCIVYGHAYVSFWLAIATAKLCRKPLILTTDATYIESQYGGGWRATIKKRILPFLYNRVADLVLVPSTLSKRFICSLGVPEERVVITPYVVDNDAIAAVAARTDRQRIRAEWKIPADAPVVVFCAKFLPRKRPQDALQAFARAQVADAFLVMVGDGPLREDLQAEAKRLGIGERVRFIGLVKYSRLPEVYAASDALVFPSEHEPYGLPVNEAMICGIPAIVSDRVGAGYDLVEHGGTGFVYPSGEVERLAEILRDILSDPVGLRRAGKAARERMRTWSPLENAESTIRAIEIALLKLSRFGSPPSLR